MKILLTPHNDDETLFAAYTIMREKPVVVVVTDSHRQAERGLPITKEQRIAETEEAMKILGAEVMFLHCPDSAINEHVLDPLKKLTIEMVYAPAVEPNGNADHNFIGKLARDICQNVKYYSTYTATRPYPIGDPITPTKEERELKLKALECYKSQLAMSNRYYFEIMKVRPECYLPRKS